MKNPMLKDVMLILYGFYKVFRAFRYLEGNLIGSFWRAGRSLILEKNVGIKIRGRDVRFHIRGKTSDPHVLGQTFPKYFPKSHSRRFEEIYNCILATDKDPLIVDCGAYVGITPLNFHLTFPGAQILAVEPSEENYRMLCQNLVSLNQFITLHRALGIDQAQYMIDAKMNDYWGHKTALVSDSNYGSSVTGISVESLIHLAPDSSPFVFKIDIEGAEADLSFADWTQILEFPVVVIEPHDWMLPGRRCLANLFSALGKHGTSRDILIEGENLWLIDVSYSEKIDSK
jgi:FkbM family methyltransferase